jgi:hypothetical protein
MRGGDISSFPFDNSAESCITRKPKIEISHSFVQRIVNCLCGGSGIPADLLKLLIAADQLEILLEAEGLFGSPASALLQYCSEHLAQWLDAVSECLALLVLSAFPNNDSTELVSVFVAWLDANNSWNH